MGNTLYNVFMSKTPASANLLRKLREESGQSLRQAASELGVAASHLSRLERGEKSPSEALSEKVAGYYGVDGDLIQLNDGRVPADILEILRTHPELLAELRQRHLPLTSGEEE
ncbi:MAG TPA: helix-turn-helix transcriptional regulator [Acidimicrobiales bacterium]|nr:helix-turn-helix transcriptional regulator [Acidimicrobiales bacterium]